VAALLSPRVKMFGVVKMVWVVFGWFCVQGCSRQNTPSIQLGQAGGGK
jgi:hypothetical protein